MLLGSVAIMNSATYFPEIVKAKTAAGLLFSMIYRKPMTGDCRVGKEVVSSMRFLKLFNFLIFRKSEATFSSRT